ncbi:MAG: putative DNA ligase [Candidatus Daviesbacteria bacterium GW2011_GWA1_41_61]|uniref:Probable DNA ligase n=1 Tax=Candidatus Daviesbacteria bacterium GW2011_GWA2_40_9 TaxID=1618424 RepID=A0A0G0WHC2_9BACT|nr:MAG: DNA ligase I, ATP-dependent Dnl1, DNA ligase 1 [Candidatus Daviesbacteria bacterium GW2011_GWC1_40_9]KKR83725.1 MAG: putative DNA ligase [Candidatus Daviesbacteria bacterium GW2011_GWA2_40_9]KKR93680.1 MAG: putative DNA ligase [Candidatus Daviesbacteria bacterium GW2011_GWB1_41_15]KKS15146.1 MAG: putative DNA ligase [Candidatus Daviesbacteria bacterium GW2011_GWA1_41_61]
MTFAQFTSYLEKLEATSSRLALIDILAQLFQQVEAKEIAKVAYLIQGRVGPFYEPIEMGMSEKLVAAAIAKAYGIEKEEVLKGYGRVGDLGLVAQRVSNKRQITSTELTVEEVFETLRAIAETSGKGTVEKKTTLLAGLLGKVDEIGAKHLVRIPLGSSRLGVGDPTLLDAFAQTKLGDRKRRKELEEAYNRTSDLGLIGQTLWQKGLQGVKKLDVAVGRPIRPELAERLPDAKTILVKFGGQAHVQYKYDGFRTELHKDGDHVRIFSRNLEETTAMLPELVEGVKKQVKAKSAILDAEALAFNPESDEFLPFQETTKRRRKYGVEEMAKKLPLKAFVFDIMYVDGKSLIDRPLQERMEVLKKVVSSDDILVPQSGEITASEERINNLFNDAITKGLEGLLVKRPDSKYEAGARNFNWVKLKRHSAGELKDTIDCVILGYIWGRGKRAKFGAGSLLVGVYDKEKDEFVTVSKIGTGLTDEEWKTIHARADKIKVEHRPARVNAILEPSVWIKPEIVIEVLADEITRSPIHTAGKEGKEAGYALRFPRLIKFREDKEPEDATTVKELTEMYQQQHKKD